MSKPEFKFSLNLNLLKPQSNPEKLVVKFLSWLLSSGRMFFVVVNALVLIAFFARFKLDADLASKKEEIEAQVPYVQSLKPYEILIRETQLKISTMRNIKKGVIDFSLILRKIANQTPLDVKIQNILIDRGDGDAKIRIIAQTQTNKAMRNFMAGLKGEDIFNKVTLSNVLLEQGMIKFTIEGRAKLTTSES